MRASRSSDSMQGLHPTKCASLFSKGLSRDLAYEGHIQIFLPGSQFDSFAFAVFPVCFTYSSSDITVILLANTANFLVMLKYFQSRRKEG